jgi:two-component sensor histidine kinase
VQSADALTTKEMSRPANSKRWTTPRSITASDEAASGLSWGGFLSPRLLLNARQVLGEDGSSTALLLAIEDVTQRRDAEREKDELLRQKEVLLQEMQHRVANSLQIIASILLLKAKTVQSKEIREHLRDAHQRVMSVATVQQQLHASGLNESINIGSYLSKLCESLAKSMVGDRRPVSIKVEATAGTAVSDVAVSLGLIVTELVINVLKHAFAPSRKCPNAASGRIRSQIILVIASIGTERIAPGAPHIQNQKTTEMMTRTGLRVNRLARSIGVINWPSIR